MKLIVKTDGVIEEFPIKRKATEVNVLDRFKIGDALLEVIKIDDETASCNVLEHGVTREADQAEYIKRPIHISIIVLSDRAASGEYEDKSGVLAQKMCNDFFQEKSWEPSITTIILPDDSGELDNLLQKEINAGVDIIFTIGSTGLGPRDIAPEVVGEFGEKLIPGVMENIRVKYGTTIPNALLSRSIAVVCETTQIYTLPGSVKAVAEYLYELFKTIEHATYMIHGLDH